MSNKFIDTKHQKYKIILVGDTNVGKTSIFRRYIQNQFQQEQTSTSVDFDSKVINLSDKNVRICLWDTAGQQKFRSIVATYFKSCQGVILIFDLTNPSSWDNIKTVWYDMAVKKAFNSNFILLGNKKDLSIQVNLTDVNQWCTLNQVYFIQCSAKTGQNIEQALFTLATLIDFQNIYKDLQMTKSTSWGYSTTFVSQSESIMSKRRDSNVAVYQLKNNTQKFQLKSKQRVKKQRKCCN